MRMQDHDPVGVLTLDSSGNSEDLTLVSAPPKIVRHHGYTLDGAADYLTGAVDWTGFCNSFFVVEITPAFAFDENANMYASMIAMA